MLAIPLELETQIHHLAECEHTDTITLLSRMVNVYRSVIGQRATQDEETLFLKGIESCLAEEWLDDEDEENYRDL